MTCSIIFMKSPKQWTTEACTQCIKRTMKKLYGTIVDIYVSLLQIRLTLMDPVIPSLALFLFNRPSGELLLRFSRTLIGCNHDESNLAPLKIGSLNQKKATDTHTNISLSPIGSTVVVQSKEERLHMHGMIT